MTRRVKRFEVGKRYRWTRGDETAEFRAVRVDRGGMEAYDETADQRPWVIGGSGSFEEIPLPTLRVSAEPGVNLPRYATDGASGLDLEASENVEIPGRGRAIVPTGLSLEIPAGYEGQIRPRSGLSSRTAFTVHIGTIDSDYRGKVGVIVENCGDGAATIVRGTRIAQLVIAPVARVEVVRVEQLSDTARGEGGFGSTGQ